MKIPRSILAAGGVALALGLAACSSTSADEQARGTTASPPPVETAAPHGGSHTVGLDEARVRVIADEMLEGFNAGDYDGFSRHWDDALRAGIPADAFQSFRSTTIEANGTYRSIVSIESRPGERTPNTTNWFVKAEFEQGPMVLRLNVPNGGTQLSGVELARAS